MRVLAHIGVSAQIGVLAQGCALKILKKNVKLDDRTTGIGVGSPQGLGTAVCVENT